MEKLFNKLFPLKCINCNQIGEIICDECLYNCEILDTQFCIICDKPSFNGYTHKECYLKNKEVPNQLISIYKYEDLIRTVIKSSKFGRKQFISLKKVTYEAFYLLKEWLFDFKDYICVPVPSSKNRYKMRGFNQSQIISEILSKKLHIEYANSIVNREKDTIAQFELNKRERLKNIEGAFKICTNVLNKNILLVDDVITTGATLKEISKILYLNGAKNVKCVTLSKKFKQKYVKT